MSLLEIKEEFYKFNEKRLSYKDSKKELLMKYLETRDEQIISEIESLKNNFQNEFKMFGENAKQFIDERFFNVTDDDYIFWFCFSCLDYFQEITEERLKDGIVPKVEWKKNG